MEHLEILEQRITEIEKRNSRVETEKAWETSLTRKLLLILFTYLTISLYMKFVLKSDPWLNAIIPSLGFYLSTLSLPFFRKIWEEKIHKHEPVSPDLDLVIAKTFLSRAEAEIARGVLETNSIKAMVTADDAGGQEPFLQSATGYVKLLVTRNNFQKAKKLLSA